MYISQTQRDFILCIIGVMTLIAVLYTNSTQPIHVHFTEKEIRRELCKDYGQNKNNDNKEEASIREAKEH